MYRESFESLVAENLRLRGEMARLQTDAAVTRLMTRPKRALRLVGAVVVVAALVANLCAIWASAAYRHELAECTLENRVLSAEASQTLTELTRASSAVRLLQEDLERERARPSTIEGVKSTCPLVVYPKCPHPPEPGGT
jgi:hypothetical protein